MQRVEALLNAAQIASDPERLSATDAMLQTLLSRYGPAPAKGKPLGWTPQRKGRECSPSAARNPRAANWLALPSLDELIELRREMLNRDDGLHDVGWDPARREG